MKKVNTLSQQRTRKLEEEIRDLHQQVSSFMSDVDYCISLPQSSTGETAGGGGDKLTAEGRQSTTEDTRDDG